MATLSSISASGNIQTGGILSTAQDYTPWYRIYHCADTDSTSICDPVYSCGYIHIRTPLPADSSSGVTYLPSMLEVMGFHTYSGDYTHYFKCIVNVDSGNSFTANMRINIGNETAGNRVYRSDNTYGGKRRVCFSMYKVSCCCAGWMWVRWRINSSFFNDYAWGVTAYSDGTTHRF